MAARPGAWGIDIGQAGLKAIRLEINDATEQVVATAFDYIAHPKILSQPDAIPEELITQALDKFLKQNDIARDVLAISVPGQSALARFIQLPPVESSKVSEIVKYEARQQIPFALEDVVWDYQTLGKGTEESGFLLEAEVGLFAMKREQVMNQLKPFNKLGLEVELIQIAPLALYNFLSFDQLGIRLGDEAVAMDAYTILLDMGADNTTLLVSNGQKIWIRNVPIGGNHFTRALTKEMKLTFAKAEHLKCNATKSPDPRAVFQALRPVFNDYVSEIQRSIGYFSSVNRDAKISKVVGLGNGFKLAGLQKFLQQNLQYEVERVDSFGAISPDSFKDGALFEENILSFPVCYGTALQALKQTRIRTSLLPREITTARTITRKKPWAVAAATTLLAALATSAFGYARVYQSVSEERFGAAEKGLKAVQEQANKQRNQYNQVKSDNTTKRLGGDELVKAADHKTDWLELYKAIDECLPFDTKDIADIRLQNRIRIGSIQVRWWPDLSVWQKNLTEPARLRMDEIDQKAPPTGGGFVVTINGDHFHDDMQGKAFTGVDDKFLEGKSDGYLFKHFVKKLQQWVVPAHQGSAEVPIRGVGISHATIVAGHATTQIMDPLKPKGALLRKSGAAPNLKLKNMGGLGLGMIGRDRENAEAEDGDALRRNARRDAAAKTLEEQGQGPTKERVEQYSFIVEFVWNPEKRPTQPPPAAPQAVTQTTAATTGAPAAANK